MTDLRWRLVTHAKVCCGLLALVVRLLDPCIPYLYCLCDYCVLKPLAHRVEEKCTSIVLGVFAFPTCQAKLDGFCATWSERVGRGICLGFAAAIRILCTLCPASVDVLCNTTSSIFRRKDAFHNFFTKHQSCPPLSPSPSLSLSLSPHGRGFAARNDGTLLTL